MSKNIFIRHACCVIATSVLILIIIIVAILSNSIILNPMRAFFPSASNARLRQISEKRDLNENDVTKARQLLEHGANPTQMYGEMQTTLLSEAIIGYDCSQSNNSNYFKLIQALLEHGANPNEKRSEEGSSLFFVIGHPELENLLLKYGALVKESAPPSGGKNALEVARDNYNQKKYGSSLGEVDLLQQAYDRESRKSSKNP